MEALTAVSSVVSIATGIGSFVSGLFAPDYTQYFKQIIDILQNIAAQQQQIIGLLAYISAIVYALLANNAVYLSTEAIQSSSDTYMMIAASNYSSALTSDFFSPHNMVELFESLSAVYHNGIQDNIDISPSLVASFKNVAKSNPKVNMSDVQVNTQTMMFFMRLVQTQITGYMVLMDYNYRFATYPTEDKRKQQIYYFRDLMYGRVVDQTASFSSVVGSHWLTDMSNASGVYPSPNSAVIGSAAPFYFNGQYYYTWLTASNIVVYQANIDMSTPIPQLTPGTIKPNGTQVGGGSAFNWQIISCGGWVWATNLYLNNGVPFVALYFGSMATWPGWSGIYQIPATDLFPGMMNTEFFTKTISLLCHNNGTYLFGMGTQGLSTIQYVYNISFGTYLSMTQYANFTSDIGYYYGYNSAWYYNNIRLMSISGSLTLFYRTAAGMVMGTVDTYGFHPSFGGAVCSNIWQSPSGWDTDTTGGTIQPVVADGIVYAVGMNMTGLYTCAVGAVNKTRNPTSLRSYPVNTMFANQTQYVGTFPLMKRNGPLYGYSINNAAYVGMFVTTGSNNGTVPIGQYLTCILRPSSGWDCNTPGISFGPKEGPPPYYWGVGALDVGNGSIPILHLDHGMKTGNIPTLDVRYGNPTAVLTNFGNRDLVV